MNKIIIELQNAITNLLRNRPIHNSITSRQKFNISRILSNSNAVTPSALRMITSHPFHCGQKWFSHILRVSLWNGGKNCSDILCS